MKEETKTTISKSKQGYGYKYTDLAQIHEYLESINTRYYQYVERIENDDYIMTVPIVEGKELQPRRGVKIVDAVLSGIKNPAQEQGSATTYARRYSLLMAFGLATEDDDAQSLTQQKTKAQKPKATQKQVPQQEPTINYRQQLISYCNEHNVDMNEIAREHKLNAQSKPEDFKKVLDELEAK